MKTKVILLLAMIVLTVLAVSAVPERAEASCSGDQCGCGEAAAECRSYCPPAGDPNFHYCMGECRSEWIACAIACCG